MARMGRFGKSDPEINIDAAGLKAPGRRSSPGSFARENERVRKLQALLEERERFNRSILNSVAANVAVIDEKGTITAVNSAWLAFARANGNPPHVKIGIGANYFDVCRQARGPDAWIALSALEGISGVLKEEREFFELEYPCHSPEVKRWFVVRATPLKGSKSRKVVVTHFDVTDRVVARQAMEKVQQDLEEGIRQRTAELEEAKAKAELYVDVMAHDIGNMSQIALGYIEMTDSLLRAAPNTDPNALKMLSQSSGTLGEISRLIGNIRRTQMGKAGESQAIEVNLGDLLERVRAQYQNIPGRNVDIRIDRKCNCHLRANELLYDVFSNLVGNSIKHSEGPVTIDIRLEWYSDHGKRLCRISIEDDGPGIPDSVKEEILHCRAPGHRSGRARGRGICLTRMLVGEFRGQLRLEDRVPGDYTKGLRAVVILPVE